jgi:hypothetical protein
MIVDEAELAPLEEHYLGCPQCAERAEQVAEYVDTMRASIINGNFDLEYAPPWTTSPHRNWLQSHDPSQ